MTDRKKEPTQRGHHGQLDDDAPTAFDPSVQFPQPAPIQVMSVKAQHESGPVAISMKTPGAAPRPDEPAKTPIVPRPKLRAISEITPLPNAQPQSLGYLAPPRDRSEVRSRRTRDLVIWSCVAVIIACGVALAIWFLAR
ncbi:MAG: hypothetical protein JO257_09635 [Deltaproteobacteria bacterium]|nr:hypothetical protein [Deltaproteobacteria bacterium]